MNETLDVVIDMVDRDVVMGRILVGRTGIEFITNIQSRGRSIELSGAHLYGTGANTMGPKMLREVMQKLMDLLDVDEVVLDGAERVTGAAVGKAGAGPRVPGRLIFRREVG